MYKRIETERLILREWKTTDIDDLVEGLNDYEVSKFLAVVPFPYTKKHAQDFVNAKIAKPNSAKDLSFAVELKENRKVIGGMGICIVDNYVASGGIWINSKYHGKGFGIEIWRARTKYCFNVLQVDYIVSGFIEDNKASRRMHENAGFKFNGEKREINCTARNKKVTEIRNILKREDGGWER